MFQILAQASALPAAKSLISAALLAAATLVNEPTEPKKPTSFGASAFVNNANKIHVAVEKTVAEPVVVLLRGKYNDILFSKTVGKKQMKAAIRLDVSELEDGTYELEIKANDGSVRKQIVVATPKLTTPRMIAMQ